jgi:hypothetical protein
MRRFHFAAAAVVLVSGLLASTCILVGCNSDPHDTHVQSTVEMPR